MANPGLVVTRVQARSLKKGMTILMEGYQFEIVDIHSNPGRGPDIETAIMKWNGKGQDPGSKFRRNTSDFKSDALVSVITGQN